MIFSPTVCHRHTSTLCVAGRGDSGDGLATCYRLDSRIWTPVGGKRFSFSHTCLDQSWGPPSLVYRGKWPSLLGAHIWGMELFTHPNVVLILRISRALPVLLLCATIGMLCSALFLIHMCGWLIMNLTFIYQHKRKAANIKGVKSLGFPKKICFTLTSNVYSYWETAKRAQFNVLFQNITLQFFFSCKIQIFPVYICISESSTFWYPQWKEWYLVQNKNFFLTPLHYKIYTCETLLTQILSIPCYFCL